MYDERHVGCTQRRSGLQGMEGDHDRDTGFDGERDTKGPADFNNNNNNKADDAADDDDEGDDDDTSQKRRDGSKSAKVKVEPPSIIPIRPGPPSNDNSTSPELDYRSNMRVSPTASTSSSSLPISGERHVTSAARSIPISSTAKRQRLDDGSHAMQPAPASLGANSNHIGSPTFPYRIDIDLPSYSSPGGTSMIPSLSQLHSQHPSLTALYANTSSSMSNIMSGGGGGSSFLPQSPFDLSRGHNAALRTVSFPPAGSSPYSPQQQQSNNLFARPQGGGQGQHSHGGSHAHGGASNMFADLLGTAGEHGNGAGHGGGGPGQFPTFDWPVHAASQGSQQSGQGQHENASQGSPTSDNNWFDFLSAPTAAGGGGGGGGGNGLSLPPPVPPLSSARYAVGSPPGMGRKRLRDEGNGASDSGESDEQGRRERSGMNGSAGGDRKS
ncbi:hypothetical protein TRAPUB_9758 [Trametes pubescens]|uniref:Uncharacterized protein n=1 Tax=Trametes pubescens TaxID=154538 RepID=A0A1M2W1B8_TRAPU|nr:hypothetical protein TRAPUB_9758 [Trametes pubescens]